MSFLFLAFVLMNNVIISLIDLVVLPTPATMQLTTTTHATSAIKQEGGSYDNGNNRPTRHPITSRGE